MKQNQNQSSHENNINQNFGLNNQNQGLTNQNCKMPMNNNFTLNQPSLTTTNPGNMFKSTSNFNNNYNQSNNQLINNVLGHNNYYPPNNNNYHSPNPFHPQPTNFINQQCIQISNVFNSPPNSNQANISSNNS